MWKKGISEIKEGAPGDVTVTWGLNFIVGARGVKTIDWVPSKPVRAK